MRSIDVDDEVYAYLEQQPKRFSDTENSVLRRLLGLDSGEDPITLPPKRTRAPKTKLSELVKAKRLSEGQTLYFYDYQGNKHGGITAKISGDELLFNGKARSMSDATAEVMSRLGYTNTSYRGPDFWAPADGRRIKDIWQDYLTTFDKN